MESSVPARDGVAGGEFTVRVNEASSRLDRITGPRTDRKLAEAEINTAGDFYDLSGGGSSGPSLKRCRNWPLIRAAPLVKDK